jgi:hypothetical protein
VRIVQSSLIIFLSCTIFGGVGLQNRSNLMLNRGNHLRASSREGRRLGFAQALELDASDGRNFVDLGRSKAPGTKVRHNEKWLGK